MSDIQNYPSNSNKSKAKHETPAAIVSGRKRKQTLGDKMAEAFLSEDTKTVKEYAIWDVLVPAIKNGIADLIIGGVQMMLFGSPNTGRATGRSRDTRSHVNYGSYYVSNATRSNERVRNGSYSYPLVEVDSMNDVTDIIDSMNELIVKYGEASVQDLLALADIPSNFNDSNWGWTDARDFHYRRNGRSYILDFAAPVHLDD